MTGFGSGVTWGGDDVLDETTGVLRPADGVLVWEGAGPSSSEASLRPWRPSTDPWPHSG